MRNESELVWVLDADLNPIGMEIPCPSTEWLHLGVDEPVLVQCGLLDGHEGNHVVHMEWWSDEDSDDVASRLPA